MALECPLCSTCSTRQLYTFLPATEYPVASKIVGCAGCEVVWTDPIPQAQTLAVLYAQPGHHQMLADPTDEQLRSQLTQERFPLFMTWIPTGRVLDIGCGGGTFLRLAMEYGYCAQGVEADSVRARQAGEASGAEVKAGDFLACDLEAGGFDLITFWDVFEHMPHPDRVLQRCWQLLKPGGYLALLVPNAGSRLARALKAHWAGWCIPFHLFHYCEQSLSRLLKHEQFEIVDMHCLPSHWIAEHSIRRLAGLRDSQSGILVGNRSVSDTALRALMNTHFGPTDGGDNDCERLNWLRHHWGLPEAAADSELFALARKC